MLNIIIIIITTPLSAFSLSYKRCGMVWSSFLLRFNLTAVKLVFVPQDERENQEILSESRRRGGLVGQGKLEQIWECILQTGTRRTEKTLRYVQKNERRMVCGMGWHGMAW